MPSTSLKPAYINELLKYPVICNQNFTYYFKESYKCSYYSWLAYFMPNGIKLSDEISFITIPTTCIVYSHNIPHVYSFYSLKDLETFKTKLKLLYKQFKSSIIQYKLYTIEKDF